MVPVLRCLIAFSALILISYGSPSIPSDACAKGEAYWCSNLKTAMECSAIKHCTMTVWLNNSSANKNLFDDCQMCKNFLVQIKEALKNPNMRKTLKVLLKEELCGLFKEYEKTCDAFIDIYADTILDFLASEIDPDSMCHFLNLCSSDSGVIAATVLKVAEKMGNFNPLSVKCDICKVVIDELKKMIGSGATRETILKALNKVCDHVPGIFKHECHDLVKKYGDKLIDLLLSGISTEKICEEIKMCPDSRICPENIAEKSGSEVCKVCEIVTGFVEGFLDENTTVDKIEHVVHKICNIVPCPYKDYCNDLIDEYGELIIHYFASHMTPHQICQFLNLCNEVKDQKVYYKCVAGPKYWCASPDNARLCEAEEHCKKYVWSSA